MYLSNFLSRSNKVVDVDVIGDWETYNSDNGCNLLPIPMSKLFIMHSRKPVTKHGIKYLTEIDRKSIIPTHG